MDVLTAALLWHASDVPQWLREAIAGSPPTDAELANALGGAPHLLGRKRVILDRNEARRAREGGAPWARTCTIDELARVILVRAAATRAADPLALLRALFRSGDNDERVAVLRALPLLDEPDRFVPLATEGCRTNVKTVFEGIACENAFPARHLPEAAFNQMVLKAVFVGVRVTRIEGLASRITPDLRRMAADYASERTAAGRDVPEDIHRLLGSDRKGGAS